MEKATVYVKKTNFDLEDAEVEERVFQAIDAIGGIPDKIRSASKILIKPNLGWIDYRRYKGRLIALTEPCITHAVLRAIRSVNKGEIILADAPGTMRIEELAGLAGYTELLGELDVKLVDCFDGPFVEVPVPGGGVMFRRYWFNREVANADVVVSIAKLKVHVMAGISLCVKNLFGFPPSPIYGVTDSRSYLHYPVRLSRMLVDLASIFKPCLNIIDGLIGEECEEWNGPPVESNLILAGTNPIATDAVGTMVMGFNPLAEFPEPPFLCEINHLKLASSKGLGPVDPAKIQILGDSVKSIKIPFRKIYSLGLPPEEHLEARKKLASEVEYYRCNIDKILREYEGKVIAILNGKVIWSSTDMRVVRDRRWMIYFRKKVKKLQVPFIKKVTTPEEDPEILESYFQE